MTDKFLKFDSQEEAEAVLFDMPIKDVLVPKGNFVVDMVGVIYKPTGKTLKTSEGPVPEMAPIPGWHVNLRGADADKFPDYEIEVETPSQSWA